MKKIFGLAGICLLMTACSEPPKPQIPALTPQAANQQLQDNNKAQDWLKHARKQNPSCDYVLDIPDQANHPTELDFTHIMKCGGAPAPLELDASVSLEYDPDVKHWVISRFSD